MFVQGEDGIRDCCLSRGLGNVYKRQTCKLHQLCTVYAASKIIEYLSSLIRHNEGSKLW